MFKRVLIANRGAIARRIIRTCQRLGIESVCCYSDLDKATPAVAEADLSARLPGYRAEDTYLNPTQVLKAAEKSGVDAIHPGYGFLSESKSFAQQVDKAGFAFVGPSTDWIDSMSEKTSARRVMANKGFPVHPGSQSIESPRDLDEFIEEVGFPIVLKPSSGGGGIGMLVVNDANELPKKLEQARALAHRAFLDSTIFAEKYLFKPRHIEFQVVGDGTHAFVLGERECSVQRRHQKLIEETPAPGIGVTELDSISSLVESSCAGYNNVGTLECLYVNGKFGFLEMNTRLQVEHGVSEEAYGVDLVELQFRIASGESVDLSQLNAMQRKKFAVEARMYAEDSRTMLPSIGQLNVFQPPELEGVRIDTGYTAGNHITTYYDPLLAKIVGTGSTREQAIARVAIALKAFEVEGVSTNSQLLQNVLGSESFILGNIHTELLESLF